MNVSHIDTNAKLTLSTNSIPDSVFTLLENLFAPGARLRLSPYVSSLQQRILEKHGNFSSSLNDSHALSEKLTPLANTWLKHLDKVDNVYQQAYGDSNSVVGDSALLYLGSRSVPQIQIVLLETFRRTHFASELHVCVQGDSAGIDAIAVIDFWIALRDCFRLRSLSCPIETLSITCNAIGNNARIYGENIVSLYLEQVTGLVDGLTIHWSDEIPAKTSLLVTFHDLDTPLQTLEQLLDAALNATIVVITPGANGRELVHWRRSVMERRTDVVALGPCGSEFGRSMPATCMSCSPRWYYPLHTNLLFRAMNSAIDEVQGGERSELVTRLDISYIILGRAATSHTNALSPLSLKSSAGQYLSQPIRLRSMGRIITDPEEKQTIHTDATRFALCPAYSDGISLQLIATVGKFVPNLRFGAMFEAQNLRVDSTHNGYELAVTV